MPDAHGEPIVVDFTGPGADRHASDIVVGKTQADAPQRAHRGLEVLAPVDRLAGTVDHLNAVTD